MTRVVSSWAVSLVLCASLLSGACSTLSSTGSVSLAGGQRWALLPMENLSTTPQAGEQAHTLLETRLRTRGVQQLVAYQAGERSTLAALLDTPGELAKAVQWARDGGFRYALSGTVHEWEYRAGAEREPVVALSLKLMDLSSDAVLWQASASRTGWGAASVSSVADTLLQSLLGELDISADGYPPASVGDDDALTARSAPAAAPVARKTVTPR